MLARVFSPPAALHSDKDYSICPGRLTKIFPRPPGDLVPWSFRLTYSELASAVADLLAILHLLELANNWITSPNRKRFPLKGPFPHYSQKIPPPAHPRTWLCVVDTTEDFKTTYVVSYWIFPTFSSIDAVIYTKHLNSGPWIVVSLLPKKDWNSKPWASPFADSLVEFTQFFSSVTWKPSYMS